ncbi:MAG: 4a-hydroxytetrahydrobiopterin dehydratase [Bacteroidales bacterium]|nr:4a-hydroxytetrahydrobiopterin dehydratase [Bacteroidales bacterium]
MMKLSQKKCVPCEGGVPKLTIPQAEELNAQLETPWTIVDGMKITRSFSFDNFIETIRFVNRVAELAEEEGHHPVMHVFYAKAEIELWTHAILGLSEKDFILAAKIEQIT